MNLSSSNLSNIRIRILFLTLFTLIPFIILVFYINSVQLKRSEESKVSQLNNITHLVALENEQIVEGARQLLITLSVTPELKQSTILCSKYLSDLLSKYQRYGNFGVTSLNGNVVCSAVPLQNPLNLSDRYFFQETLKSSDFTVGEYVISRATNQASVNFGFPLSDNTGVVYATLDLNWLNKLVSGLDIDKDLTVLVLDRGGTILARNPQPEKWVGQAFPEDPLVEGLTQSKGTIETSGIDGVTRLYSYERIGNSEDGPFVIVGQPKSEILKDPLDNFKKSIALFFLAAIVSIWVGIWVGNSLIGKAVEKIKELESLKRDFISLASHQIRTPATAIKWFTEILLSHSTGALTKRQQNILKDIHLSVRRMIELIGMLLNVSKLESNRLPINPKPTSIPPLIRSVVWEVKNSFKNKKIKLEIKLAKNLPPKINVDPKLIRHVFLNLLHNAFKYSHPKGVVEIEISKQKGKLLTKVTDYGIGIPLKEKGILFQKFSRASNARLKDTEGAGLGLYLAKLIVGVHKGKIGFLKTKGKGTSIYFTIPITKVLN